MKSGFEDRCTSRVLDYVEHPNLLPATFQIVDRVTRDPSGDHRHYLEFVVIDDRGRTIEAVDSFLNDETESMASGFMGRIADRLKDYRISMGLPGYGITKQDETSLALGRVRGPKSLKELLAERS